MTVASVFLARCLSTKVGSSRPDRPMCWLFFMALRKMAFGDDPATRWM